MAQPSTDDQLFIVTRNLEDPIPVLYARTTLAQPTLTDTWHKIAETTSATMSSRQCYGIYDHHSGEYRACVQRLPGDPVDHWGYHVGQVDPGWYAFVTITGETPALYERIAPMMKKLFHKFVTDPSRLGVEFYRTEDEVELWVPVSEAEAKKVVTPK